LLTSFGYGRDAHKRPAACGYYPFLEEFMPAIRSLALAFSLALTVPVWAADADYKIVQRIKVPDGRFDYATYDSATNRVYMSRSGFTTVIDVATNTASQLNSAADGHMTLAIPGTTFAVVPRAPGMGLAAPPDAPGLIRIIDLKADKALIDLPAGVNPDGAVYDAFSKSVFVMNHVSGQATIVDPVAKKIVGMIPVGGTLEFPASDGIGHVFVNVQSVPEIAVIDVTRKSVTARYKLEGCKSTTGLAYAAQSKVLISSCANGVAKVLDAATGKEVASIPIGAGPDAVIYDPVRQRAFIPCGGDGVLEVISVPDPAHIAKLEEIPTQPGSRTGTVDPNTGRLYLMASKPDPTNSGPRGGRLAGSFEVLVIAPE
jgi:DNA-binding beta-propeller fold protein YncE